MFQKLLGLSLVAAVSAHQNFHQFWVNDVTPGYQVGIRMPPSNSPVTDVTSDDIACNVNGSDVPSGVTTATASEGDSITVNWDVSSHPGPITHFLFGPVDDAAQATGIGAGWFKIDERDYVDGAWANEYVGDNGGNYTFSLPTGLQSGDYLLRSEMLALHSSETVGGAQFYIGCAQLTITGTGSGSCTPTISLPGAYTAEDDDIYIPDFYNGFDATTYTAPGGDVAACGGSSPATTAAASSTATSVAASATSAASSAVATSSATAAVATSSSAAVTSVAATTSAPVAVVSTTSKAAASTVASSAAPTETASDDDSCDADDDDSDDEDDDSCDPEETAAASSAAPTSTFVTRTASSAVATSSKAAASSQAASAGTVPIYYQCGGTDYTGATECASGTCTFYNDYYSQCI
ncbi:endoglucanase II (glycosyl hydrolase family 61) [Seiridium cupressi]